MQAHKVYWTLISDEGLSAIQGGAKPHPGTAEDAPQAHSSKTIEWAWVSALSFTTSTDSVGHWEICYVLIQIDFERQISKHIKNVSDFQTH